jgi:hypothetical protein
MRATRGKPTQVKVWAKSDAERERWRAEAKRRKWSLTTLVREAVNREIERAESERGDMPQAVGE